MQEMFTSKCCSNVYRSSLYSSSSLLCLQFVRKSPLSAGVSIAAETYNTNW
jgi:hypothetical protein